MHTRNTAIRLLALTAMLICSCDGGPAPQPLLKGNLHGRIVPINSCGDTVADRSGFKVTAEGTSFSTISNADGTWTLKDLPAGTYILSYSKMGYGPFKEFGYQFVGGGDGYVYYRDLYTLPTWTVSNFTARSTNYDIQLRMDLSGCVPGKSQVLVFFSDSSSVSNTSYRMVKVLDYWFGSIQLQLVDSSDLHTHGMPKGSTVHIIAYPSTSNGISYVDLRTGAIVREHIDPANHSATLSSEVP